MKATTKPSSKSRAATSRRKSAARTAPARDHLRNVAMLIVGGGVLVGAIVSAAVFLPRAVLTRRLSQATAALDGMRTAARGAIGTLASTASQRVMNGRLGEKLLSLGR